MKIIEFWNDVRDIVNSLVSLGAMEDQAETIDPPWIEGHGTLDMFGHKTIVGTAEMVNLAGAVMVKIRPDGADRSVLCSVKSVFRWTPDEAVERPGEKRRGNDPEMKLSDFLCDNFGDEYDPLFDSPVDEAIRLLTGYKQCLDEIAKADEMDQPQTQPTIAITDQAMLSVFGDDEPGLTTWEIAQRMSLAPACVDEELLDASVSRPIQEAIDMLVRRGDLTEDRQNGATTYRKTGGKP